MTCGAYCQLIQSWNRDTSEMWCAGFNISQAIAMVIGIQGKLHVTIPHCIVPFALVLVYVHGNNSFCLRFQQYFNEISGEI